MCMYIFTSSHYDDVYKVISTIALPTDYTCWQQNLLGLDVRAVTLLCGSSKASAIAYCSILLQLSIVTVLASR